MISNRATTKSLFPCSYPTCKAYQTFSLITRFNYSLSSSAPGKAKHLPVSHELRQYTSSRCHREPRLPSWGPLLCYTHSWQLEKKGQTFPPVLHLLETLIKCSERKKRKGGKKPQPFFFCFCCLEGSRKHLVPAEASNALGRYPATLNSPPRLLIRSSPGDRSSTKAMTVHSHRLDTVRKTQAALCWTPRPKLKWIPLEPNKLNSVVA